MSSALSALPPLEISRNNLTAADAALETSAALPVAKIVKSPASEYAIFVEYRLTLRLIPVASLANALCPVDHLTGDTPPNRCDKTTSSGDVLEPYRADPGNEMANTFCDDRWEIRVSPPVNLDAGLVRA